MRLKRILLSLTAFVLALSSALPAGAEAFTIPAANTHKAKPSWWPDGTPAGKYNVRDFAALNGELWCIYVNGESSGIAIKLINGKTFEAIKDININGISGGTFPLACIRRMGNQIVACNAVSNSLRVYRWKDKNSAPDVILSLDNFMALQGMGVWGDMNDGKLYFLKGVALNEGSTTLCIFTVKNGVVNSNPTVVNLPDAVKGSTRQYSITSTGDGNCWITTNSCYGICVKESDGSIVKQFTGKHLGAANGIGQKHFTFLDRKLAVSTNCCADVNNVATNNTATWTSPVMGLIDYTVGVGDNQTSVIPTWGSALSTLKQNTIATTGADYEISDNGNHLDVWGLDPIGGFYHAWYMHTSAPGIVQNFTATARWEGAGQKVDLTWAKDGNATSYKVFKNSDDLETATEVWSGTDTKCTLDLTLGTGLAHKYSIKGYNEGGVSAQSAYASTFEVGFGAVNLEGNIDPNDTKKAKLSWNAPAHGTLQGFEVIKRETKNGSDNSSVTTDTKIANLAPNVTTYDYPNYTALVTTIENGITYNTSTRFLVRAKMAQTITTEKGEQTNEVLSNAVAPNVPNTPYFTSIVTYKGRRTVALTWEVSSTTNLKYYEVYRDGIKILSNYEGSSYIDAELPDGNYSYVVKAYYDEGGETVVKSSLPGEASITYSPDVTNYILDCIYDYPIMTQDEWTAASRPADAVVAKGWFANAKTRVGPYGAPGDAFRQAQFYNGKWYLAQLTACDLNPIPRGYWDYPSGTDIFKNTWKGGAYFISADNDEIKTIGDAGGLQFTGCDWYGLGNQFIALDDDGVIIRRSTKSDLGKEGNFYRPTRYLYSYGVGETDIIKYNGKSFLELSKDGNSTDQHYRTHYISAGGSIKGGTGYALLAMNKSADVYRVNFNTNGTVKNNGVTKFTPNLEGMVYPSGKDAGKPVDPWGSTENYAFPVPGRNGAFIQTVRSIGTWYVDPSGHYSLMYDATADITQSGGVAFTYNDEFFVLHPSTVRSNNPGYFRIDVAECGEGETAATVVPSKNNLIPCVGNKLEEVSQFVAGNSNCSWYGAEYDTADDCIYIYQYVPGVRFAKYRLYKRDAYPDVPVNINITTGYDDETNPSDITRFDCKITWNRPSKKPTDQDHSFGLPGADIVVDHYEVALKDQNGTVLETWKNKKDEADVNYVFTIDYSQNASGEFFINADKYTAEIVPVYKRKNGTLIRGGMNYEVAQNDYPAAIGEANAYAYEGSGSAKDAYRVDLDFDRALPAQSSEPVSYFLVEVSTDGGNSYKTLSNFNLLKQGEDYHYYPEKITNGQVPGQYKFGTTAADSPSEKGYAMREKANYATDHKCVLYYYTNTNPSGYKYRITAVYASTNARISKSANTTATATIVGTSGIGDATGYSLSVYPVPATTAVTVTSPEAIESVRIFSTAGAEVARVAGEKDYTQSVDVSTLASGVYMIVINEQTPIRIVKK